jgi:xanthine dehydrogenase large subunit
MTKSPLHRPQPHESGPRHASGAAIYVDDIPPPKGMLVGHLIASPVARGRIVRIDPSAAQKVPGVACVLTAADIPGINDISPFSHDEPLLADREVFCVGQHLALVIADSLRTCRIAAKEVLVDIEERPAILDIQSAVAQDSFIGQPHVIRRGDADAALAGAQLVLRGEVSTGGQDHFYLETHCALCVPEENETYRVYSSTQHPAEVQAKVAEVLHLPRSSVVVETARMGGGFGGKETQGAHFGAFAALGAHKTKKPVKVWLNRDQDMAQTGKRHPWWSSYEAGFDGDGRIVALKVDGVSDGGWSADLSQAIRDRYLFHLDNGYYIPNLHFRGRIAKTNSVSNTAFRGFGGPQGMVVIETIMNRAAERLRMDPAEVRRRNYYGNAPRDRAPYDQVVEAPRLERIHGELLASSSYAERKAEIETFNASSKWIKRGIAYSPVKFGISFTSSQLNQAGALVLIYMDGSVQVNHGGTEMGQGLHTKMLAVASHELGVPLERIRLMNTATDKVPNTSATAASSGSDLNGQAVKLACETLKDRLRPIAAEMMGVAAGAEIRFEDDRAIHGEKSVAFSELVLRAYLKQVSLSAAGYYRTPDIHYDANIGRGKPFHYYAYGGAVTEVEVNGLTGEHRMRRVDILHDVGDSLVPTVDVGQIEGAFIQGFGWLTCEEVVWDKGGKLISHSPDTYKIPAIGEAPLDFRVALLANAPEAKSIHGSKAVGEPPLMLAISAVAALRHAVLAFAHDDRDLELSIPCTPEAVLRAVERMRDSELTERVELPRFATREDRI